MIKTTYKNFIMYLIYVLKCQNNKYYIGKTQKLIEERFLEHLINPCSWTMKYPPIEIIHYFELKSHFDEDNTTLEYMRQYGIENVRGGSYSQIWLPKSQYMTLQNQIIHADDKCYKCKQKGHYIKNCPENKLDEEPTPCFKCGSLEHLAWNCHISCWEFLTSCFKPKKNNSDYIELE